jgi:FAD:protein FMN transferase
VREGAWSRRGFLTSRGLTASAGGFLAALLGDKPSGPLAAGSSSHVCVARRAMGCDFSVYLPPDLPDPVTVAETALSEIEAIEDLLSVYRGTSAISYVNQHAASGPVRCDARLYDLLKRCAELSEATGGAFDVSAGALVKAWGFLHPPRRVPGEAERLDALARTGMRHVSFDDQELAVRFGVAGLEINFGSIGKGYAIDRAVRRLRQEHNIRACLMQGGQSSMYALGAPASDIRGWLIGIENPLQPSERIATVRLRNRALGTSGTAHQYFEENGRRYGHVMDPRRGEPAGELASVSVIASDAATADALSTALFVLGLDKAIEFCDNHSDIAALIVLNSDGVSAHEGRPRVLTLNLSPQDVNVRPEFQLPARPTAGP